MKNINSDINQSKTLNKKFYIDDLIFNQVIDKIFKNSWQLIVDINFIKKNKIFPFTFLQDSIDEPMVFINNNDVQCFSNVCTHRAHIVVKKKCNKKKLTCRYHGRTFNLDGTFKNALGFTDVKKFPSQNDNLIHYQSKLWNNFLFASINSIINIDSILNDINKRLPTYNFSNLNYDDKNSNTYILNAHWALYCENYLEGFHVPFIHKGLTKNIAHNTYETILIDNGVLQIAEGTNKKESILDTKNIYAFYYWLFPNLMINIYNWGLSINIIEPIEKSKTRIRFLSYPLKGKSQPSNLDSSLDNVELEDKEVILEVQKGIESDAYQFGRYSPKYEKGLHHFHMLLRKYITDLK